MNRQMDKQNVVYPYMTTIVFFKVYLLILERKPKHMHAGRGKGRGRRTDSLPSPH